MYRSHILTRPRLFTERRGEQDTKTWVKPKSYQRQTQACARIATVLGSPLAWLPALTLSPPAMPKDTDAFLPSDPPFLPSSLPPCCSFSLFSRLLPFAPFVPPPLVSLSVIANLGLHRHMARSCITFLCATGRQPVRFDPKLVQVNVMLRATELCELPIAPKQPASLATFRAFAPYPTERPLDIKVVYHLPDIRDRAWHEKTGQVRDKDRA